MATNKRLIKSNDDAAPIVPTSFNTVLYTGNGTTNPITTVGFQPDLVWGKQRNSSAQPHVLIDSVRGRERGLASNNTNAENNYDGYNPPIYLSSFDDNGFTLGVGTALNQSGIDMVAWCWKAGGAAVTNTDGTITSQVSANTEAGFSVVSYTGNGTTGATFGHGLDVTPKIMISKRRDIGDNWNVYTEMTGNTGILYLNLTDPFTTVSNRFNNTSPTDAVFTLGNSPAINANNGTYIAYCFAEVAGFSKFGSYTGTGAGVQNTINCGFAPRFVMIKRTNSTGGWRMYDNVRGLDKSIQAQSSDAEYDDTTNYLDFYANGFEFNNGVPYQFNPDINASGGTYIYMAFANQF